jgi:hypothetical protein
MRPASRNTVTIALAIALASGLAPQARATPPPFSVHDLDRNGYLDRAEFERLRADCRAARAGPPRRPCALRFDTVDTNADGRLDEGEVLEAVQRARAARGRLGDCR